MAVAIGLTAFPVIAAADGFACQVASITDGDTFRCTNGLRIRIGGIDAPEMDTSYGPPAKATLAGIIGGATAQCEPTGTSYNRIVAVCYLDGQDIGAMMVERAMARDCARYSGGRYGGLEDERHDVLPVVPFCIP
ncbi:MAG: thermonuclease family protein [Chrysiogenetes bacterium]|nr:thermonuclease family protein [Chrysiogenetes bacterium]